MVNTSGVEQEHRSPASGPLLITRQMVTVIKLSKETNVPYSIENIRT
jgi:hypothetical protein